VATGFRIIGPIEGEETMAAGHGIRELRRLNKAYGKARWRKRKGLLPFDSQTERSDGPSYTGTKRTVLADASSRSSASSERP
jgi:hypothetical protein